MDNRRVDAANYLKEPASGALERAYRDRDRPRCSKGDFAAGFIAALKWLNLYERYRLDRPEPLPERRAS